MSKKKVSDTTETATATSEDKAPGSLGANIQDAVDSMNAVNVVEDPASALGDGFDVENVPDINAARNEAKGKGQGLTKDMLDRPLIFVSWRPQRGMIAATGEYKSGFFCVIMDVETKKVNTLWLGNIALCRELRKLKPPFRAKIVPAGRTLIFA